MKSTPIPHEIVDRIIKNSGVPSIGQGTIREIVRVVNQIENETGIKYIRMEMGVPGLKPPQIGIDAEITALRNGVASKYPMIEGVADLKMELQRFVKLYLDIDVNADGCLPTVGSMQGSFAVFMVANRTDHNKKGTVFLDPGFPVQKQQVKVLGQSFEAFDVYDYRGEKLREKLESYLKTGEASTILYSNPNNPSWICFTENELQIIGELATKYDVIVVEDLAYFGMDFRKDYSHPGVAPYQPTVAKYTNNYILLISSSKAFSYAGQRIGTMVVSDSLFNREYPELKRYYNSDKLGYAMIYGALYACSSGASHSAQYGLAAMLKAANDGDFNFVENTKIYGQRAGEMKRIFVENGFEIVYDFDENDPVADGFYFTVNFSGYKSAQLLEELLYYGISAISLEITGSSRQGIRACVSQTHETQFNDLEERLKIFKENHSK